MPLAVNRESGVDAAPDVDRVLEKEGRELLWSARLADNLERFPSPCYRILAHSARRHHG